MSLELRCDCGYVARGDEASLVEAVQDHACTAHNTELKAEAILALASLKKQKQDD